MYTTNSFQTSVEASVHVTIGSGPICAIREKVCSKFSPLEQLKHLGTLRKDNQRNVHNLWTHAVMLPEQYLK